MVSSCHSVGTVLAIGGLAAAIALPQSVSAANPIAEVLCETTPSLHERLSSRMRSGRVATGLRGHDQIFEVWTDKTGAWTMVLTYATGTSCIVAMGENWSENKMLAPAS